MTTCSTELQSDPDEYAMVDDTCVKELEEVLMLTQDLPECKASREANSMPVTDLQPGRREELARRLRDKLRFVRALRTGSDRQLVEAELVGFRYQELPENLSSLKWTAVWCKSQQEMIKLYKLFGETRDGILPPLTNRKVDLGKMRTKGWYPPNFVRISSGATPGSAGTRFQKTTLTRFAPDVRWVQAPSHPALCNEAALCVKTHPLRQ